MRIIILFITVFCISCTSNILEDFADSTSTEAKLAAISDHMDDEQYDDALVDWNTLSASEQAERANQVLLAKIYAGQCGLNFLQLSEDITGIGSNTLLATLMQAFPGATATNVTACVNSEATILGIDTDGGNRTTEENLLMAYVAWSKMGVILSTYADADADGVTDAAFDPCNTGDLAQIDAQHMATGIANMLDGLGNIGSSDVGGDQLTAINAICTLIDTTPGLGASYNFCTQKETSGVTSDMEDAIRSIITEGQDIGIAADGCAGSLGSSAACICP